MLKIDLSHLVGSVVESELRGEGRKNEALYFNFDIRLSYYTGDANYSESCGLHLLYNCQPGSRCVTVFSGVVESPFDEIRKVNWEFKTSHDSCWRDICTFSDVYFGMANKINARLEADGLRSVAPREMSQNIFIKEKLFSWVSVEIQNDPLCERGYRKIVTIKR